MYSGNEATRFTIMRTQGTGLLTVGAQTWSAISRHSHSYRRATKAGESTLEQAKTVLSTRWTLSQATKVRLRYKRVDFLGMANRIPMVDMLIFIALRQAGRQADRRQAGRQRGRLCVKIITLP